MIVTVIAVRVMQVAVDEVVDVIAVGNGGVSAVRPVHVIRVVPVALVRSAVGRVGVVDRDRVLVVVTVVGAVEVSVVQVADVVPVLDRDVAAVGSVRVGVVLVDLMCHSIRSV